MEFASNNEGVNGGTLSEYKRLTRQLWDLRDEAISNAFILDDVKVILQLADEIIKESTWFQFLREFGPNNEVEKSAFALVSVLCHQIIRICKSRVELHLQISKYFVQSRRNAIDPTGHQVLLIESDIGELSSKIKYEIKPSAINPPLRLMTIGNRTLKSGPNKVTMAVRKKSLMPTVRSNFTNEQRKVLKAWLFKHKDHPFPTEMQKNILCEQVGITHQQLNTWFVNNRKRLLAGK